MASIALEDEFGDVIGKARFGLGKSLREVASASGVSESELRALENYEREPTEEEARAIAAALALAPERLLAIARGTWSPRDEPLDGDEQAQVIRLKNFVGGYPVFSYILVCRKTRAAAPIDTAAEPDQVIDTVRELGLTPQAILLTHGHADHVEGIQRVQRELDVPIVMSEEMPAPSGIGEHVRAGENDTCTIGALTVRLLKTPGHTAHCATFLAGSIAISGDVIFAGSVGKPNYSYDAIRASIRDKLFTLPDETRIYPGHGPSTTVGEEKAHNPFFGASL